MTRAIWCIIYDLPSEGRDDYLAWFHEVHMPEKLARPGYQEATHYEVTDAAGNHISSQGAQQGGELGCGYIAIFSGSGTQVFLNPSPAQIKPHQTPLTREMIAKRIGQRSFIAAEEWRATPGEHVAGNEHAAIALSCCDTPGGDEAFGAWCIQKLKPATLNGAGVRVLTKFLTTTGLTKHVILVEADCLPVKTNLDAGIPITHMIGAPFYARRIAP